MQENAIYVELLIIVSNPFLPYADLARSYGRGIKEAKACTPN